MDGIGCWEQIKKCLALSASVQALSDHENVERQLLPPKKIKKKRGKVSSDPERGSVVSITC